MKLKFIALLICSLSLFGIIATLAFIQYKISDSKSLVETKISVATKSSNSTSKVQSLNSSVATFVADPKIKLPVIMFHHINDITEIPSTDTIGIGLRVNPVVFEQQLLYLQVTGYQTINMDDLYNYSKGYKKLPPKPVLLTFDDGYKDSFTKAFPILQKYKMKGDFAIITKVVGQSDYMSWDDIKALQAAGNSINSHTLWHCSLAYPIDRTRGVYRPTPISGSSDLGDCPVMNDGSQLDSAQVNGELVKSKAVLEQNLGTPVHAIIYPFGHWNKQTEEMAKAAGYSFGFTTMPEISENVDLTSPYSIPRYRAQGQQGGILNGFFAGAR